jgi:outer membrane protein TolC
MRFFFVIIFSAFLLLGKSPESHNKLFSVDEFIQIVKQYHPIVKQAGLQIDKAKSDVLSAKGQFDPTINVEASRKTFDGKNYYYYTNPELKIPLPIGDIKTGIENNGGNYLNTEESYGKLSYFGIEIPLAKGLVLDKRRAALQQAKIFENQSEQDKIKAINDLLYNAYTSYWQWVGAYQLFSIYNKYVQISTDRLRLVRIASTNGDKSLMDTIEAFAQLQNVALLQSDALMKLNTATLDVSAFLWQQKDSAYLLPINFVPDTLLFTNNNQPIAALGDIISSALVLNPSIRAYNFKLESLEVERRLKKQNFLPTLNAKANILNKDYIFFKGVDAAFLENNYKWGINFKLPIFLREARGEYQKSQFKIAETNLDLKQKKWELENKLKNYYNEFTLLQQQLQIVLKAYNNYNTLYQNEILKFSNGESSLFLVNSRETKALEIQQKSIELRVKYFKAQKAIEWAAGTLR